MKFMLFMLACLGLGGCGVNYGFVRDASTHHGLAYDMSKGFHYLRTAAGSSSGGSVLCLIPVQTATYAEASDRLLTAAALKPNQVLVNLREDHASRFMLLWCMSELILSGDVVEIKTK